MNCKTVLLKDLVLGEKGSYGIGAPAVDYDPKKYTYLRITDINDDGSLEDIPSRILATNNRLQGVDINSYGDIVLSKSKENSLAKLLIETPLLSLNLNIRASSAVPPTPSSISEGLDKYSLISRL